MAPPNYILDPRYETIGCAVRLEGEERSTFIDGPNLPAYLAKLDPATTTTIAFNALFDSCILAWRYNFVPARIMCTMRMAVALRGHLLQRHSLAEVGRSLGVGEKGDAIVNARGKRRADMVGDPVFWRAYQAYACNDNDMSRAIFHKLIGEFPAAERRVMDRVLRCAVVPRFVVDTGMLRDHLVELKEAQAQLLIDAGAGTTMDAPDRADRLEEFAVTLRSNAKFEKVLKAKGVEIEYKQSTTDPERQIPAFAKTDPFMAELQNSDDVELQALAAARLGLRSTIEETRGQRLLSIAELPWPGYCDGNLPVPLRYAGAHTHRLCLDGSMSLTVMQNSTVRVIRLDQLAHDDLVWDGESFVSHGGLVYAGIKKVIEYDGIIGTPDHRVWTVEHGYCSLAEAKTQGYDVARGNIPDATRIDPSVHRPNPVQNQDTLFLQHLRWGNAVELVKSAEPQRGTLQGLLAAKITHSLEFAGLGLCATGGDISTPPLHKPKKDGVRTLRSTRGKIQVFVGSSHDGMDFGEPWAKTKGEVHRPGRQQRSLRTGQPSLGNAPRAEHQQAPTWDIVDCGPRNRFVANGKVVHNSGDWSINMQNLPSGRGGKISKLRKSLCAPPGYKVVVADKAQIEARITAFICGQQNLLDLFAQRLDPYAHMASLVFGYDVNKADHPAERFIGKTAVLGLGYGCGPTRFFNMVLSIARNLGVDIAELEWDELMADRVVKVYRLANANIVRSWKWLDSAIAMTWSTGTPALLQFGGPVLIGKGYVEGPGGLCMRYGDPRFDAEEQEYKFSYGSRVHKLYGAKLLENIVQFLARINTMHDALRISDRGFPFALTSHDELVFIVPDHRVKECMEVALEEMCRAPSWAPDIPLDAEVSFGQSYGSAKK